MYSRFFVPFSIVEIPLKLSIVFESFNYRVLLVEIFIRLKELVHESGYRYPRSAIRQCQTYFVFPDGLPISYTQKDWVHNALFHWKEELNRFMCVRIKNIQSGFLPILHRFQFFSKNNNKFKTSISTLRDTVQKVNRFREWEYKRPITSIARFLNY